jgi:hypothetical protein
MQPLFLGTVEVGDIACLMDPILPNLHVPQGERSKGLLKQVHTSFNRAVSARSSSPRAL